MRGLAIAVGAVAGRTALVLGALYLLSCLGGVV